MAVYKHLLIGPIRLCLFSTHPFLAASPPEAWIGISEIFKWSRLRCLVVLFVFRLYILSSSLLLSLKTQQMRPSCQPNIALLVASSQKAPKTFLSFIGEWIRALPQWSFISAVRCSALVMMLCSNSIRWWLPSQMLSCQSQQTQRDLKARYVHFLSAPSSRERFTASVITYLHYGYCIICGLFLRAWGRRSTQPHSSDGEGLSETSYNQL